MRAAIPLSKRGTLSSGTQHYLRGPVPKDLLVSSSCVGSQPYAPQNLVLQKTFPEPRALAPSASTLPLLPVPTVPGLIYTPAAPPPPGSQEATARRERAGLDTGSGQPGSCVWATSCRPGPPPLYEVQEPPASPVCLSRAAKLGAFFIEETESRAAGEVLQLCTAGHRAWPGAGVRTVAVGLKAGERTKRRQVLPRPLAPGVGAHAGSRWADLEGRPVMATTLRAITGPRERHTSLSPCSPGAQPGARGADEGRVGAGKLNPSPLQGSGRTRRRHSSE